MLRSKDLGRNEITIFNFILSARLICILDFIFAETTLTNRPHGPQIAGPQPVRAAIFLLDHQSWRCRERLSQGAKKI
jgi:hypothetical protein